MPEVYDYEGNCPDCGKFVLLDAVENFDECPYCGAEGRWDEKGVWRCTVDVE